LSGGPLGYSDSILDKNNTRFPQRHTRNGCAQNRNKNNKKGNELRL
jgi:hypothetical protein